MYVVRGGICRSATRGELASTNSSRLSRSSYIRAFWCCCTAIVVDRKASLAQGSYDLWPAAAKSLGFGPSFEDDVGCIKIRVMQGREQSFYPNDCR